MKHVNIMGVHQFLGGGGGGFKQKIYEELPKKGALDILQGDWQKIGRRVFLWGSWYLHAHYDLNLVHPGTWDKNCWCEHIKFWSIFHAV